MRRRRAPVTPVRRSPHDDMLACSDHIATALRAACDRRDRSTFDALQASFARERAAVLAAANDWASRNGYATVTADDVDRLDRLNVGHVDWFSKLCLHVARLVVHGS